MTPGTCPAFYPIGMRGTLHRTEPELNTFVKRHFGQEMIWLKWRAAKMAEQYSEKYKILVSGEINPEPDPAQTEEAGKFRGYVSLVLVSQARPGQWAYPITILFNGGRTDYKPKTLIEVPLDAGFRHEHLSDRIRSTLGTRKYLLAKRSQRLAIADFLDRFFIDD